MNMNMNMNHYVSRIPKKITIETGMIFVMKFLCSMMIVNEMPSYAATSRVMLSTCMLYQIQNEDIHLFVAKFCMECMLTWLYNVASSIPIVGKLVALPVSFLFVRVAFLKRRRNAM